MADNLNAFVGLSFNSKSSEFLICWRHVARGSLKSVLSNQDMTLNDDFKNSFANDIIKVW